ncbi:Syndecan [Fasciola hepatica]|uniref:Syndecan n=1 Tax=Fasciola hepatica TaxID=6192 RepID=A0A4E0RZG5_FASHE|nr:Syndecan [Fasciola hepatica]
MRSDLHTYGAADLGLIVPYRPKCDPERPHLFQSRQCSEHDCFCVNVTTGAVLLGTRASPSEVGNCSAAIYSILLALRTLAGSLSLSGVDSIQLDKDFYSRTVENRVDDVNLTPEQDMNWRRRIRHSLESILQSTAGYQRILSVSPLVTVPTTSGSSTLNGHGGLLYYRAHLVSIGHTSLQAPQDLVQHRLHEGYLPEVGNVDRDISRIELMHASVIDPSSLAIWIAPEQLASSGFQSSKIIVSDEAKPDTSKIMSVRSPLPHSDPDAFAPDPDAALAVAELPGSKVEQGYWQLPLMDDDGRLTEAIIAARQSAVESLHQPWAARASRVNILRQPGVIAGIVGSVVVVLLLLILLILFCIYRLRKRDEGSYALDEPKKTANINSYQRAPTREFYA